LIHPYLIACLSVTDSGSHGELTKAVEWGHIAAVGVPAEQGMLEQFSCARQYLSAAFPPIVHMSLYVIILLSTVGELFVALLVLRHKADLAFCGFRQQLL